jgi:hypothetical protein
MDRRTAGARKTPGGRGGIQVGNLHASLLPVHALATATCSVRAGASLASDPRSSSDHSFHHRRRPVLSIHGQVSRYRQAIDHATGVVIYHLDRACSKMVDLRQAPASIDFAH